MNETPDLNVIQPAVDASTPNYGIFDLVLGHDDVILKITFLCLVVMSILSWATILYRGWRAYRTRSMMKKHWNQIIKAQTEDLDTVAGQLQGESPVKTMLTQAIVARDEYAQAKGTLMSTLDYKDYLKRHIRHAMGTATQSMDGGLTLLETIGATAPFIGLFGTVWGIYHALINISLMGSVNIATIAGPIGEALIATAFGLFVAIPAVFAYNALNRTNRLTGRTIDAIAYDLYHLILRVKA